MHKIIKIGSNRVSFSFTSDIFFVPIRSKRGCLCRNAFHIEDALSFTSDILLDEFNSIVLVLDKPYGSVLIFLYDRVDIKSNSTTKSQKNQAKEQKKKGRKLRQKTKRSSPTKI